MAGRDWDGYGHFGWPTQKAHRISWVLNGGDLPEGMEALHRCDNPPCVNPAHLFLGTGDDNRADQKQKGRYRHGSGHQSAKLDEQTVAFIRGLEGRGYGAPDVAWLFQVSPSEIYCLWHRRGWKHVA